MFAFVCGDGTSLFVVMAHQYNEVILQDNAV